MKSNSPTDSRKGFTLIEMLVTVTIIVILAGLSLGGFNFVNAKQARSKAQIQIKLLETGLEQYKFENGEYPTSSDDSSSNDLFTALYWEPSESGASVFVADLNPESNGQGWTNGSGASTTIEDPWGNEYQYTSPGVNNPDFDLLSIGPDGKTSDNGEEANDDISNF